MTAWRRSPRTSSTPRSPTVDDAITHVPVTGTWIRHVPAGIPGLSSRRPSDSRPKGHRASCTARPCELDHDVCACLRPGFRVARGRRTGEGDRAASATALATHLTQPERSGAAVGRGCSRRCHPRQGPAADHPRRRTRPAADRRALPLPRRGGPDARRRPLASVTKSHQEWKGAAVTIYPQTMKPTTPAEIEARLPSQAAGEAARRARDRRLTMSQRLERVHRLCAQLASLTPIRRQRSG